jgi:peroxiredoxin family protein
MDAPDLNKATILLASGELDKAIVAFEVAASLAAMGSTVNMWFILYGANCIKKPKSLFSLEKWFSPKAKESPGRNPATDVFPQKIIGLLNHDGAEHLPLSQLNYLGLGPRLLKAVMRKKGSPTLLTLIQHAEELGVNFKICQPCVDTLRLDVNEELIVTAEVAGTSSYVLDVKKSHYNAVF